MSPNAVGTLSRVHICCRASTNVVVVGRLLLRRKREENRGDARVVARASLRPSPSSRPRLHDLLVRASRPVSFAFVASVSDRPPRPLSSSPRPLDEFSKTKPPRAREGRSLGFTHSWVMTHHVPGVHTHVTSHESSLGRVPGYTQTRTGEYRSTRVGVGMDARPPRFLGRERADDGGGIVVPGDR